MLRVHHQGLNYWTYQGIPYYLGQNITTPPPCCRLNLFWGSCPSTTQPLSQSSGQTKVGWASSLITHSLFSLIFIDWGLQQYFLTSPIEFRVLHLELFDAFGSPTASKIQLLDLWGFLEINRFNILKSTSEKAFWSLFSLRYPYFQTLKSLMISFQNFENFIGIFSIFQFLKYLFFYFF